MEFALFLAATLSPPSCNSHAYLRCSLRGTFFPRVIVLLDIRPGIVRAPRNLSRFNLLIAACLARGVVKRDDHRLEYQLRISDNREMVL